MSKTRISVAQLHTLVSSALESNGLNKSAATTIASVVADAERDGCHSHGIFRVPGYVHAIRAENRAQGLVRQNPWREPKVSDTAPALVSVDAFGGFAAPAFAAGRSQLVAKARSQGVACMSLSRTRHFSALWWEVEGLANEGLVSLAVVNTPAFVAHGPGGRSPVYGTNPLAFGCPRSSGQPPLVFDQATAAMARGEMQLLHKAGLQLPPGVALDPTGAPTSDPALGLQGAQLPAGGHKGANLALLVEVLAAGLTASPFAPEARMALDALQQQPPSITDGDDDNQSEGTGHEPLPLGGAPTVNGELIIALDPARFLGLAGNAEQDGDGSIRSGACSDRGASSGVTAGSSEEEEEEKNQREAALAAFTSRIETFLDLLISSGESSGNGNTAADSSSSSSSSSSSFRLPGQRRYARRAECEAREMLVDVDADLLKHISELGEAPQR